MSSKKPQRKTKNEIYKGITDKFILSIDEKNSPFHAPYKLHLPISSATDKVYGGANNFFLMSSGLRNEYESDLWITGRAAAKKGYAIDPAEKRNGTEILLYTKVKKPEIDKDTGKKKVDENGDDIIREWFLPKSYYVYNLSQFTDVPVSDMVRKQRSTLDIDETIQAIANDLNVSVTHGFRHPAFDMDTKTIQMPSPESFESESSYNVTLLQQLVHASGTNPELKRIPDILSIDVVEGTVFDPESEAHAKERFIGSLGSVMVAALIEGLDSGTKEVFDNQAAEVKGWVNIIRKDPSVFISATREAQKAVNFLTRNIPELNHIPDPDKEYKPKDKVNVKV